MTTLARPLHPARVNILARPDRETEAPARPTLADLRQQYDDLMDEQVAELRPYHDLEHDMLQRAEEEYEAAREQIREIHRAACRPIEERYAPLVEALRGRIQEASTREVIERNRREAIDCGGDLRALYEGPLDGRPVVKAGEFFGL